MKRQRIRKALLLIALLLFQVKILHLFMSPVVPVFAARMGIVPGSLVVYGVLFLSSLILGRAFCGWFCPGAAMQEILSLIRSPARAGRADRIKYGICGGWSLLVLVTAIRAGGFHGIDSSFGTQHGGILQEFLMRVDVDPLVAGPIRSEDCILCGNCVDACPSNSVQFVWTENPKPRHADRIRQSRRIAHRAFG
jgi:polyferredoxin